MGQRQFSATGSDSSLKSPTLFNSNLSPTPTSICLTSSSAFNKIITYPALISSLFLGASSSKTKRKTADLMTPFWSWNPMKLWFRSGVCNKNKKFKIMPMSPGFPKCKLVSQPLLVIWSQSWITLLMKRHSSQLFALWKVTKIWIIWLSFLKKSRFLNGKLEI